MTETLRVTSGRTATQLMHPTGQNVVALAPAERGRYRIGDKVVATSSDHHQVKGTVTYVDDGTLRAYWLAG